ncbi:Uncharacterised protein [Porphyromonas macacae]|uniref:ATP-grasp domain-containing protein n=1 Tax=Porphyromonas macacae TaxID=28115 RepID=A0A379EC51_9PORP|nr:hypothetical protein [Porphyromonas macacae]SUB89934.1 Uncharacterised protein [Porphyromonas macacae]
MTLPRILVYNPGHEEALPLAPKATYTPPRIVWRMMTDLGLLARFEATPEDLIYIPNGSFEIFTLYDHKGNSVPTESATETYRLSLWGAEPHTAEYIRSSLQAKGINVLSPVFPPEIAKLSHRALAAAGMHSMGLPARNIPVWISCPEEMECSLANFKKQGITHLLAKLPFTGSGRGLISIELPVEKQLEEKLLKALKKYGSISIEPFLNVSENWATEWYCDGKGAVVFTALSHFITRTNGAYDGNILAPQSRLYNLLESKCRSAKTDLSDLLDKQQRFLSSVYNNYNGFLGVDMFFHTDDTGNIHLHPCVEINVRQTMGLLAHQIYEALSLAPKIYRFCLHIAANPLKLELRLPDITGVDGYIPLTPIQKETTAHAYLLPYTGTF